MKRFKKFISLILCIFLLITPVFAHPDSTYIEDYYIGKDSNNNIAWKLNRFDDFNPPKSPSEVIIHWSSSSNIINYTFPGLSTNAQNGFIAAADNWNTKLGTNIFTESTTNVKITVSYLPNNTTKDGEFTDVTSVFVNDNDYHKHWTTATIKLKPTYTLTTDFERVSSHELGHALGLGHTNLSSSLMKQGNSVTDPNDYEIMGAKYALGIHTTHGNFIYTVEPNYHHKKCGICSLVMDEFVSHTYPNGGNCECGNPPSHT